MAHAGSMDKSHGSPLILRFAPPPNVGVVHMPGHADLNGGECQVTSLSLYRRQREMHTEGGAADSRPMSNGQHGKYPEPESGSLIS